MKKMSRRFLLAGLGVMSVLSIGMTGSASASILFLPATHKFPYHMTGVTGVNKLETVGGLLTVTSPKADVLLLVLNQTLADVHIRFLETTTTAGGKCNTAGGATGEVLVRLLSHIGLIDPGRKPGVLELVPAGFEFECKEIPIIGTQHILVKGAIIGAITHPGLNVDTEVLGTSFSGTKGVQEFTTFLLGNETLTNQHEESSVNHGAFENSSQSGEPSLLKALPGEGAFLLILP